VIGWRFVWFGREVEEGGGGLLCFSSEGNQRGEWGGSCDKGWRWEEMGGGDLLGGMKACVQREGLGRVAWESGGSWFSFVKAGAA